MTVPAPRVRRRPSVPGRVLPLLLVAALLAPVGLLFAQTHRLTGDDRDLATRERLGVQYLRALGPVTDALVDAQTAAVTGRPVSRDALTAAVEQATSVDSAVGDELRSHERWSGLRAKLEALPDRGLTDPTAAFAAYGEVTDLLLDLHRKIRDSSGLIRDPQSDSFFLQDGIGRDLPEAMVAAGRLADLTALAAQRPAAERPQTLAELAALRVAALAPATDLVADLRAAVDNSESTDLGANVLTPLDTYQRSVEALAALSAPTGKAGSGPTDPAQVAAARLNAQAAAKQLQPVILDQLDALLKERIDRLDRDRLLAVAAAALAGLLVVVLIGVLIGAYLRARWRAADERRARDDSGALPAWQPPAEPRQLQPVGSGRPGEPERWGPFDAAR
ncbi:hypothetical protein EV384_0284 [Micromonospora kangleipakensis]|uniref:Nitrate/nitrite sensing protein n=1 Tax=Micromonospora kangleipakensis TaxID=1077942 RepID=A0A4Q8B379_9ACTN|nr:hypothetical protein [Micromonospora kangleipakensis]RZU71950.1 hypothetical protein EV384_0284 [Micromonospora kangleipakensis]